MANFIQSYNLLFSDEGGWVCDKDDPGGETYRGISRKNFSKWEGWTMIDLLKKQNNFPSNLDKDQQLQEAVLSFYEINFWDKMNGDQINDQNIAHEIFDFGINAGITTSITIAQMACKTEPDGVIGPQTLEILNGVDTEIFLALFTIGKVARYIHIVKKRPVSRKYFYGWICRAFNEN